MDRRTLLKSPKSVQTLVISNLFSKPLQNGEWVYSIRAFKEEFFAKFPIGNIVEANFIAHIRKTVNRFVAPGRVEKGKVWEDGQ
jgi:hypothetical protein